MLHLASAQSKHLYRFVATALITPEVEMLRLRGRKMKHDRAGIILQALPKRSWADCSDFYNFPAAAPGRFAVMKAKHLLYSLACAALFLTAGQAHAQELASLKATLAETNRRYFELFQHKDALIVDLYTADACLLSPNAPAICGKVALAKDFTDTYAAGQVSGVKFQTQQVYGAGKEYVTEQGTWQVFDANGKVIDDGKYLKLWKKTSAGWKIFRDVFNSDHKS